MIRDLLGLSKEPLELEFPEAAETFNAKKGKDIEDAKEKAEAIRSDVIQEVEELEENLEEFEEFEDEKDRQVINDVVDNVISERLEKINELTLSEDPEELYSELNEFITDFQSLKQKEAAVLEEAYLDKKISRTIGGLESKREKLGEFLESEYQVVTGYREVEQLLEKRENILDEIEELEGKIEKLDIEELESELEDIEKQLSELEDSQKWKKYEFLKGEIRQKRTEKKKVKSDLKTSLAKMERGLKKLIYQAENGDASVSKIDLLEKLRDKQIDYILENPDKTVEAVREAEESLPEDLLNSKQQEKFEESIKEIEDLPQKSERLESLDSEIEELEKQVEGHSAVEEKSELKSERKTARNRLEDKRDQKDHLEKQVENKQSEVEETENRIREVMNESFDREVKIN